MMGVNVCACICSAVRVWLSIGCVDGDCDGIVDARCGAEGGDEGRSQMGGVGLAWGEQGNGGRVRG